MANTAEVLMTKRGNIKVSGSTEECSSRTMLTRYGLRATLLAGTALAGVAMAQPAAAQTTEWLGLSTDWFDAANWDNGVPAATDTARIGNANPGGAGTVIDQIGAVSSVLNMRGDESRLTIENGGVLATGTNAFIGSHVGTDAAVLVTGAASSWEIATNLRVADALDSVALVTVTDGAALQVNGQTTIALIDGGRASTQFQMGDMTATARGMIGWRHAFGDTTPASRVAFAGGNSFLVSGAPIAKNAAVMEFGLDMQVGTRATLGLSYDGQLASGSNEHGARARLRVSFWVVSRRWWKFSWAALRAV